MKSFAAALLALSAYGSQIEATTQVTTGATAEIEAAVESHGYGLGLGYGGYSSSLDLSLSDLYDSYSSDYSHSDYFSSDYSDHDYGFGYRRRFGRRLRFFRYRPRYYGSRYLYGRRYASRAGLYNAPYSGYGYRSYGFGYRGLHGGYRRSLGGYGGYGLGRRGLW